MPLAKLDYKVLVRKALSYHFICCSCHFNVLAAQALRGRDHFPARFVEVGVLIASQFPDWVHNPRQSCYWLVVLVWDGVVSVDTRCQGGFRVTFGSLHSSGFASVLVLLIENIT